MSPKQISLVGGLLVIWPWRIQAHDIYKDLLTRSGLPCCHNGDCRPVPYRLTPKGVQMFVDEQWLDIRRSSIQYRILVGDRGETGGGHWCGLRDALGILPAVRSYRPSPPPLIRASCGKVDPVFPRTTMLSFMEKASDPKVQIHFWVRCFRTHCSILLIQRDSCVGAKFNSQH